MADTQKVSPSTSYTVQGSPDDYNYVLKGADLILVNKHTHEEQTFLFVGNIMSLDGQVNMKFSNGQSLDSPELFNRSEMPDMDKQDEEAPQWKAVSEDPTPSEEEGNSEEGNLKEGQLEPIQNAQAALVADPTDDILKTQQRMFDDIDKFAEQDSLSSDVSSQASEKLKAKDSEQEDTTGQKAQDELDKLKAQKELEEQQKLDEQATEDNSATAPNTNSGKVTIALSQESESGILKETAADAATNTDTYEDDGITNKQELKIVGTADPNTVLEIFMDGEKVVTSEPIKANADGNYELEISGAKEGEHEFYAQIVDSTNDNPGKSSTLQVEVDLTDPTLNDDSTVDSTSIKTFDGVDDGIIYTNQTRPLLEGTGEKDTILTISYDGTDSEGNAVKGTLEQVTVNSSGNWSVRFPEDENGEGLPKGEYTFTITGVDDAGNALAESKQIQNVIIRPHDPTNFNASVAITLDTQSDSTGTHIDSSNSDEITNNTEITLNITQIDSFARIVKVYTVIGTDKTYIGDATYVKDGEWTFNVDNKYIPTTGTAENPVDIYKFAVDIIDVAGNSYTPLYTHDITIDRTADNLGLDFELADGSDSQDDGGHLSQKNTTDADKDNYTHGIESNGADDGHIELTGSGAGTNGRVNLYLVDAAGNKTHINTEGAIVAADGTWTYSLDVSMYGTNDPKELTIRAEITDVAGNVEGKNLIVTVDNDSPDATVISADTNNAYISPDDQSVKVPGSDVALKGILQESSDDLVVTLYECNGDKSGAKVISDSERDSGAVIITPNGDGTYSWAYTVTGMEHDHSYSYYVKVEDAAGNETDSTVFTFKSDQQTEQPSITLDDTTDTGTTGDDITALESESINLKVSCDDDATVKVYMVANETDNGAVQLSNGLFGILISGDTGIANGETVSYTVPADHNADNFEGAFQFVAVATDNTDNTSISTVYNMIVDDEAPEVTGANSIEIITDTGAVYTDDAFSNAKTLELKGTFEDGIDLSTNPDAPAVSDPVVYIYDDAYSTTEALGTATVTGNAKDGYTWSYKIGSAGNSEDYIEDVTHEYHIVIEDAAGNRTAIPAGDESIDITIDRTPPEISARLADETGTSMDTGNTEIANTDSDWITKLNATNDDLKIEVTVNEAGTLNFKLNDVTYTRVLTEAEVTDGKAFIDLSDLSDFTPSNAAPVLNEGTDNPNNIEITLTDKAGNPSEAVTESLVIDRDLDPGDISLNADDNTGNPDDTVTMVTSPTLEGKTEAGATVTLTFNKMDGDTVLQTITYTTTASSSTGKWEITPDADLTSGKYNVEAVVTDIAGNTATTTMDSQLEIVAEPHAPTISLLHDTTPLFFDSSETADDGVTAKDDAQFTITKEEGTTIIMKYWTLDDYNNNKETTGTIVTNTDDAMDVTSFTSDTFVSGAEGLGDGKYVFEFTAKDANENSSETVTKTITIDSEYNPADLTVEHQLENGDVVDPGADGNILTNDNDPKISGTAEAGSQVRMVIFKEGETPDLSDLKTFVENNLVALNKNVINVQDEVIDGNKIGKWSANPSFGDVPEDQNYQVVIVSEDQAGNLSYETIEFHHDSEPPAKPEIALTVDQGALDDDGYTDPDSGEKYDSTTDLTPTLSGTASKDASGEITTKIVITSHDDDNYAKTLKAGVDFTIDENGNWSYHVGSAGDENFTHIRGGTYTATITSTDTAGNVSSELVEFHIEQNLTSNPTIGLDSNQITAEIDGITYTSLTIIDSDANPDNDSGTMLLEGKAIAYSKIVLHNNFDNTTVKLDVDAEGNWQYPLSDAQKTEGTIEYYVTCEGKTSDTFTLVIDNSIDTPPTINVTAEHDSGSSDSDWITNDPTISGEVEKNSEVTIKATRVYTLTADGDTYTYTKGDTTVTISAAEAADLIANNNIFTGEDGNTYFADSADVKNYTVDSTDTADGNYSKNIKTLTNGTLSDGQYQITVTSTDKATNTESVTSNKVLVLDTTTTDPSVKLDADSDSYQKTGDIRLANGTDVGDYADLDQNYKDSINVYDRDTITNDRTPTITGTAEANAVIAISILFGSTEYSGFTTQADDEGNWNFTFDDNANFADGKYTVSVRSQDTAGNDSATEPTTFSFHRDTRVSGADVKLTGDDHAHFSGEQIAHTQDATPTLTLSGEEGSAYILYYGDEAVAEGTFGSGKFNYVAGSSEHETTVEATVADATNGIAIGDKVLADGEHNYRLVVVDKAGNVFSENYQVNVDTVAPDPITDLSFTKLDDSNSEEIAQANSVDENGVNTKVFNLSTNDNDTHLTIQTKEDTATVVLIRDDGSRSTFVVDQNTHTAVINLVKSSDNKLTDGDHTYRLEFYDDVENHDTASDVTVNLNVDTQAMSTTINMASDSDRGFNEEAEGIILTSGNEFKFVGEFKESVGIDFSKEGIDYLVTVTNTDTNESWTYNKATGDIDGAPDVDVSIDDNGNYELTLHGDDDYNFNDPGNDGNFKVEIAAVDKAGNQSDSSEINFEIDNNNVAAPEIGIENINGALDRYYLTNSYDSTDHKAQVIIHNSDGSTEEKNLDLASDGKLEFYHKADNDDYIEVKIIDKAGNESDSYFRDLDNSDLNYSAEVGDKDTVDTVEATITGDFDNDGTDDFITATGTYNKDTNNFDDFTITGSSDTATNSDGTETNYGASVSQNGDSWQLNFADNFLKEGGFKLNISSVDNGTTPDTVNTDNFNFRLEDMDNDTATSTDRYFDSTSTQDFNGGAKEGNGGDTATHTTDNVVVDAEVHQDHIEFDIA